MDWLLLIIGLVFLIQGANLFVSGASSVARRFHVSPMMIGLTIVAFGTSAPEAAVSVAASLQNLNDMALGNVVGSSLFNLLVVLGIVAVISPVIIHEQLIKKEFPFALLFSFLLICFFFIGSRVFTRFEGGLLLVLFAVFIYLLFRQKRDVPDETIPSSASPWKMGFFLIIGMVGIAVGGYITTTSASNIAVSLGMSELLVGLTVISVGTSLPELLTSAVAALRKEMDMAIGNIIGSNIFNIGFVLSLSMLIQPIALKPSQLVDLLILFGVTGITMFFAFTGLKINRVEGALLLLMYGGYLTYIIMRAMG